MSSLALSHYTPAERFGVTSWAEALLLLDLSKLQSVSILNQNHAKIAQETIFVPYDCLQLYSSRKKSCAASAASD
jgi:hypothetical protein